MNETLKLGCEVCHRDTLKSQLHCGSVLIEIKNFGVGPVRYASVFLTRGDALLLAAHINNNYAVKEG